MKLSDLKPITVTSFSPVDKDGEELPITIKSHTFNSDKGAEALKKHDVDQALYANPEKGIKYGDMVKENEIKALAKMTIEIDGLDDVNTPNEIQAFYSDPEFITFPQQLNMHLKSLGNGITGVKKKQSKKQDNT